ncbi:MAG: WbqC family protein [Desulfovibrionaceae bacterium]
MSRVVAIHQPNFFPWPGYFAKIARADVFIFLDAVDYPRSGSGMGSYTNRVKLNIGGAAQWWGCPVHKLPGKPPIHAVEIDRAQPWVKKRLATLEQSYAKAPHFKEYQEQVRAWVGLDEARISTYNIANVRALCRELGIGAEFVLQSEIGSEGASTDLLVDLVRRTGGDTYLAGRGAALQYQEEEKFQAAGIELRYIDFHQQSYPQAGTTEFLPGLSMLDALFNLGAAGAAGWLAACIGTHETRGADG